MENSTKSNTKINESTCKIPDYAFNFVKGHSVISFTAK